MKANRESNLRLPPVSGAFGAGKLSRGSKRTSRKKGSNSTRFLSDERGPVRTGTVEVRKPHRRNLHSVSDSDSGSDASCSSSTGLSHSSRAARRLETPPHHSGARFRRRYTHVEPSKHAAMWGDQRLFPRQRHHRRHRHGRRTRTAYRHVASMPDLSVDAEVERAVQRHLSRARQRLPRAGGRNSRNLPRAQDPALAMALAGYQVPAAAGPVYVGQAWGPAPGGPYMYPFPYPQPQPPPPWGWGDPAAPTGHPPWHSTQRAQPTEPHSKGARAKPMDRDQAATKIQRWYRKKRRNHAATKIQRFYRKNKAARRTGDAHREDNQQLLRLAAGTNVLTDLVDDLVDEFLATDAIPELLLDVFTKDENEFAQYSPQVLLEHALLDEILSPVIREQCETVVREVLDSQVRSYMARRERRSAPSGPKAVLNHVVSHLVEEVLSEEVPDVVTTSVEELVKDYIKHKKEMQFYTQSLLAPIIRDVCESSLEEVMLESIVQDVIAEELQHSVQDVVVESMDALKLSIQANKRAHDEDVGVSVAAQLIDTSILQYINWKVATRNEHSTVTDHVHGLLNRMLADSLLLRFTQLQSQYQHTRRNAATKLLHEEITADIASSVLVDAVLNDMVAAARDLPDET